MSKHDSHQARKKAARPGGAIHGILIVDKPAGITSHDVVSQARRVFRTRKIGHAGTLDPMATGVLVLLLGEATKLSNVLTASEKHYTAEVTFGRSTHSLDATGETTKQVVLPSDWLTSQTLEGKLDLALSHERKRTAQIPPLVSAIKIEGERAYKKARRGEEAVMAPRVVSVKSLSENGVEQNRLSLDVLVSKGFYVRGLARDLGDHLGVPAHLSGLRRIASGAFRIEESQSWPPKGTPPLISVSEAARENLASLNLSRLGFQKSLKGQVIVADDLLTNLDAPETDVVYGGFFEDRLVALMEYDPHDSGYRVKRGILLPDSSSILEPSLSKNG